MNLDSELFLHEEVLLLALRDEKGTIAPGTTYSFAIGGAILAELLLARRVGIVHKGKKKRVELLSREPLGDALLDECLQQICEKKVADPQGWVIRFASSGDLHRVAQGLCRRGILRLEEKKVMLIFNRKVYPERDGKPERELIKRLEKAIFTETRELDPRTMVLVALADSSGLLAENFEKARLNSRKHRIKLIIEGNFMSQASKDAIEAVNAAIMIAAIVPVIITPVIIT